MPHDRLRSFNKSILNPLILRVAGSPRSLFAVIHHTGRQSGKPYETPIIVEPLGEGFVFALTYGSQVDWYRNVLAAGGCTLLWHGRLYSLEKPEPVDVRTALPAFPPPLRFVLQRRNVQEFMTMKRQGDGKQTQGEEYVEFK
jgi:deazaflavin-dependent oxidoreductase (nitroreductase family)